MDPAAWALLIGGVLVVAAVVAGVRLGRRPRTGPPADVEDRPRSEPAAATGSGEAEEEWPAAGSPRPLRDYVPYRTGSWLQSGSVLSPGDVVLSDDDSFALIYEEDGDLALYTVDAEKVWSSGTRGLGSGGSCAMQEDGNLVIRGRDGQEVWSSGTAVPGSSLRVQDDGDVVIYGPDSAPVWSIRS